MNKPPHDGDGDRFARRYLSHVAEAEALMREELAAEGEALMAALSKRAQLELQGEIHSFAPLCPSRDDQ